MCIIISTDIHIGESHLWVQRHLDNQMRYLEHAAYHLLKVVRIVHIVVTKLSFEFYQPKISIL